MGLLSKLKSVLGLGSGDDDPSDRRTGDVGVTVERERDEADAANEAAVKGVDEHDDAESEPADATEDETEPEHGTESEEPHEPGADADAEAEPEDESPTEAGPEADEAEADAEAGDVEEADAEAGDVEEADTDDAEADAEDDEESEPETGGDLQDIKGIGPAYADRLSEVGIESIGELADADFEAVADEADLAPGRVEQWVDRANARQ